MHYFRSGSKATTHSSNSMLSVCEIPWTIWRYKRTPAFRNEIQGFSMSPISPLQNERSESSEAGGSDTITIIILIIV